MTRAIEDDTIERGTKCWIVTRNRKVMCGEFAGCSCLSPGKTKFCFNCSDGAIRSVRGRSYFFVKKEAEAEKAKRNYISAVAGVRKACGDESWTILCNMQ